jgi:hypothetical protein
MTLTCKKKNNSKKKRTLSRFCIKSVKELHLLMFLAPIEEANLKYDLHAFFLYLYSRLTNN